MISAHNHGTAWLDLGRLELTVATNTKNSFATWRKLDKIVTKTEVKQTKQLLDDHYKGEVPEKTDVNSIKKILTKLCDEDITKDIHDQEAIEKFVHCFPLFGLQQAFKKFQTKEDLSKWEESAVIKFADWFVSCTTNLAVIKSKTDLPDTASDVRKIVEMCNTHCCTKSCFKYSTGECRYVNFHFIFFFFENCKINVSFFLKKCSIFIYFYL